MAEAVTARWHGDNYQARVFWDNAFNLLAPGSCVAEVTFEANGPKAFDDVVVKYDPPVARSGPTRVSAEYPSGKMARRIRRAVWLRGFRKPRLHQCDERLAPSALAAGKRRGICKRQLYVPNDVPHQGRRPLGTLVSANDKSLLVERLFDDTTDRSRMGKVRSLWRTHLSLATDEDLRTVVTGLRVVDGYLSLEELRTKLCEKAAGLGLVVPDASDSDFRYDELARQLKVRRLNGLTRPILEAILRDERLLGGNTPNPDGYCHSPSEASWGPPPTLSGPRPKIRYF